MTKLIKFLAPLSVVVATTTSLMVSCGEPEPKPELLTIKNVPDYIAVGAQAKLTAVKKDGEEYENIKWTSSNTNAITIEQDTGVIKAIGAGSSIITAQSIESEDIKNTCSITVANPQFIEYNLAEVFSPTITPLGGKLNPNNATKRYLEEAIDNPTILADDLAFTWDQYEFSTSGYTNISVKPLLIDLTNSLISMDFKDEGKVPIGSGDDFLTSQHIYFENIPIFVGYDKTLPYDSEWGMAPTIDVEWLLENDNWHFYQKDTYQTASPIEHDWNKQKLIDDPSQEADVGLIMLGLMFSIPSLSYYLSTTQPN